MRVAIARVAFETSILIHHESPFRGVERLRLELSMRKRGGFTDHLVHPYLRSSDISQLVFFVVFSASLISRNVACCSA